jgi:hypothetical protein
LLEQLSKLKEQRKAVEGTACEVFSRVVGYLRPVSGYNKGKKEEFKMRKMWDVEKKGIDLREEEEVNGNKEDQRAENDTCESE